MQMYRQAYILTIELDAPTSIDDALLDAVLQAVKMIDIVTNVYGNVRRFGGPHKTKEIVDEY